MSMLPDAAATESLLLGEHGLLAGCCASHVHVVMGTIGSAAVRALAEKARATGVALVDAPVSGSVSLAEAGTITAMVGAEPDVFATVRPVLAAMTRAQFHTGPGRIRIGREARGEPRAGVIEPGHRGGAFSSRLPTGSTPRCSTTSSSPVPWPHRTSPTSARSFLSPETADVAFPISLLQKDVGLGLELAREHSLDLPVATTVGRVLEEAREGGLADRDMAEVLRLLRDHHSQEER